MPNHDDEPDPREAVRAAVAAAELGGFDGIGVLLGALAADDWELRLEAAYGLTRIGCSAGLDPLCRMARVDTVADNRAQAIYGLEGIGRPEAMPTLIEALGDAEDLCRQAARTVLFRLAGAQVLALIGDEGDELDPDEPERLRHWWAANLQRFDPGRVYALGTLATPGVFIERCKTSGTARPDAYLSLLQDWTGQNFGESPLPDVIAKWDAWWTANSVRYEPGRRYFYGHPVP